MIICITGTNTDAGKTIATAALAAKAVQQGVNVRPVKPVQTGEPEGQGDVFTIERLTGISGYEKVRYPEPLAPNLSASRAGITPTSAEEIVQFIRALDEEDTLVLVEGAGGLLVNLGDGTTIADLARALGAPLVVVTSLGLGSLNAAQLTVEAATARGVEVLGLVGGSLPQNPDLATTLNLEEFPNVTGRALWGSIPEGAGTLSRENFLALVETLELDSWLEAIRPVIP